MRKLLWIVASLATIAGFIAYMEWPTLLRMKVERARARAAVALLNYVAPKDLVAYNDDNAAGKILLQKGGYEKEGAWRGVFYMPPPLLADGAAIPRDTNGRGAVFLHGLSDG